MGLNQHQVKVVVQTVNDIFIFVKEHNDRMRDMGEKELMVAIYLESGYGDGVIMTSHPKLAHPDIMRLESKNIHHIELPPLSKLSPKMGRNMLCYLIADIGDLLLEDVKEDMIIFFAKKPPKNKKK